MPQSPVFALSLSGGGALGAYQAGVYEALHVAGRLPHWIVGASSGAINGALIAGNAPADRIGRLRDYWQPATTAAADDGLLDEWRRTMAVPTALLSGRVNLFSPRGLLFPAWPFGNPEPPSLLDTTPLGEAMERLVDFGVLNGGDVRYCAAAIDVDTGEDVVFDTAGATLSPQHVRASGALIPVFPPVEVDGRLLGDAGISANLPLDPLFADPPAGPMLVIAVDLLPPAAPRPRTLTDVASRMQDLNFATQSRRTIEGWRRLFAERLRGADAASVPAITLIHLIYADQGREVIGKAFDFSPATVRDRWDRGRTDAVAMLAMLDDGRIAVGEDPGLHVHRIALTA